MTTTKLRNLARGLINNKAFEIASIALVIFSLVTFVLETMPTIEALYADALDNLEAAIVILFTAEYFIRLIARDEPSSSANSGGPGGRSYAFSFLGIVDLVTILPFYISILGIDGRPIRAFRLVRVFRLFKLMGKFGSALNRIRIGWTLAKEELIFAMSGSLLVIFLASVFIYFFERQAQPEAFGSVPDALWWAVVTFTTVGYGDVTPITDGGKIFSFVLLLMALVMVGVPAGIVASALSMSRETLAAKDWQDEHREAIKNETQRLEEIKGKIEGLIVQKKHTEAREKLALLEWKRALVNPHLDSTQTYSTSNRKPEHAWELEREKLESSIQGLGESEG